MCRVTASLLLTFLIATTVAAQVQSRTTDAPIVTADNESWYATGEPIQFAGDVYYRAGASVFFNGNTMVRTGHNNGVPLYADTTLEPYSVIYVPLERGLMQPYERRRQGSLAGTTASRTPSFPVQATTTAAPALQAAGGPTMLTEPVPVGTSGIAQVMTPRFSATSIGRPTSNDGLWIRYLGKKWVSAGAAVLLTPAAFREVGRYEGFPVFASRGRSEQVIYLPTRAGLVAPYRLKQ